MLNEYWEDFNVENKITDEKRRFKFLDLDDPFASNFEKILQSESKLFDNFEPTKSPILENYDQLSKNYKMPSKTLLSLEKNEYSKYIKVLRKVNKV